MYSFSPKLLYSHQIMQVFYRILCAAFPSVSVATDSAHVSLCASSHTETKFRSWKSLSMQMVCSPWHQQTDVRAKNSGFCRNSLSEDRLILHSFIAFIAIFKVVSTSLYFLYLIASKNNCCIIKFFVPRTEIIHFKISLNISHPNSLFVHRNKFRWDP